MPRLNWDGAIMHLPMLMPYNAFADALREQYKYPSSSLLDIPLRPFANYCPISLYWPLVLHVYFFPPRFMRCR